MNRILPFSVPVWNLGFRPFFLMACIFSSLVLAKWLFSFGAISVNTQEPAHHFSMISWHAHEMVYGYISAVIAGFLLTAVQNWTGVRGVHGARLAGVSLLWAAARCAMIFPFGPHPLIALIDLLFYPALGVLLFSNLSLPSMKSERFLLVLLAFLFFGNLQMHLAALGLIELGANAGAVWGVNITLLMVIIIGGRVLPFFAASEKARSQPVVRPWVEKASVASTLLFVATQTWRPQSGIASVIAVVAAVLHSIRLWGWYIRRVRRVAILWVLFGSYAWIVLGFLLTGISSSLQIMPTAPLHAFTVGGLGVMTLGMMTRVSLGHTGRPLKAPALIILAYLLMFAAAFTRVFGPILFLQNYLLWVRMSGVFWILAFVLVVWVYAPILLSSRIDGKEI